MTTDQRLITAASALLDSGGEDAVTMRAVGHAAGLSHNASYKHFANRDALLAAVATTDFLTLAKAFQGARLSSAQPTAKLTNALTVVITFSKQHAARYRLIFSSPDIATYGERFDEAASVAFNEFIAIVRECQTARELPNISNTTLASLLFAAMQGLIALEANGRMHREKGLTGVGPSLDLLVQLLGPRPTDS